MKLRCLIVDDELIAGKGLERYCKEIAFLQLEGICNSAGQAREVLKGKTIDLIFLDIRMPGQTGLEFLKSLASRPMVIITTAYPEFALEGFELDVMDYIVKPFAFERFLRACEKAKEYFELKKGAKGSSSADHFFIRANRIIEKIVIEEILFIEALENYVAINTIHGKCMALVPMKVIEKNLEGKGFVRVHKSFLVAKGKIKSIEGNKICIGAKRIQISRKWKREVLNAILENGILKR